MYCTSVLHILTVHLYYTSVLYISRQLAETVERSRQTVGSLEGTSKAVEELGEEYR